MFCSLASIYSIALNLTYILFLYNNNFIRTKALVLAKYLRTSKNKATFAAPQNIVSRLAISKIIRKEYHNRAWLSIILHYMWTSSTLTI